MCHASLEHNQAVGQSKLLQVIAHSMDDHGSSEMNVRQLVHHPMMSRTVSVSACWSDGALCAVGMPGLQTYAVRGRIAAGTRSATSCAGDT